MSLTSIRRNQRHGKLNMYLMRRWCGWASREWQRTKRTANKTPQGLHPITTRNRLGQHPNELEKYSTVEVRVPPQPTRTSASGDLIALHPQKQKDKRCFINKQARTQTQVESSGWRMSGSALKPSKSPMPYTRSSSRMTFPGVFAFQHGKVSFSMCEATCFELRN